MKPIILYGAGYYGERALKIYNKRVAFLCDKNKAGDVIAGISVIGLDKLKQIYQDYEIIVTPLDPKARGSIAIELGQASIPYSFLQTMHDILHIYGSYPHISFEYETGQQDFRIKGTLELYKEMFSYYGFDFTSKHVDIWVWVCDEPFSAYEAVINLGLSHINAFFTVFPLQNHVIPIPDYLSCGDEEKYSYIEFSPFKCRIAAEKLWVDRRCFWRGSLYSAPDERRMLFLMGEKYPNWLRIERSDRGKRISMVEQARYKYLIDIRGRSWTDRIKILLQLGRPVLIVDRPYKEWYFERMVPMEHYVPIKEDLSDLIPKLEYLEAHPEVYEKIVRSTKKFVKNNLIGEPVLKYLRDLTLANDVVPTLEMKDYMWDKDIYQHGMLFDM